jgi:hypothetical protein
MSVTIEHNRAGVEHASPQFGSLEVAELQAVLSSRVTRPVCYRSTRLRTKKTAGKLREPPVPVETTLASPAVRAQEETPRPQHVSPVLAERCPAVKLPQSIALRLVRLDCNAIARTYSSQLAT